MMWLWLLAALGSIGLALVGVVAWGMGLFTSTSPYS